MAQMPAQPAQWVTTRVVRAALLLSACRTSSCACSSAAATAEDGSTAGLHCNSGDACAVAGDVDRVSRCKTPVSGGQGTRAARTAAAHQHIQHCSTVLQQRGRQAAGGRLSQSHGHKQNGLYSTEEFPVTEAAQDLSYLCWLLVTAPASYVCSIHTSCPTLLGLSVSAGMVRGATQCLVTNVPGAEQEQVQARAPSRTHNSYSVLEAGRTMTGHARSR